VLTSANAGHPPVLGRCDGTESTSYVGMCSDRRSLIAACGQLWPGSLSVPGHDYPGRSALQPPENASLCTQYCVMRPGQPRVQESVSRSKAVRHPGWDPAWSRAATHALEIFADCGRSSNRPPLEPQAQGGRRPRRPALDHLRRQTVLRDLGSASPNEPSTDHQDPGAQPRHRFLSRACGRSARRGCRWAGPRTR
jgi:hypothetical protein